MSDAHPLNALQILGSSARSVPFDTVTFETSYQRFWLHFRQTRGAMTSEFHSRADWTILWVGSIYTSNVDSAPLSPGSASGRYSRAHIAIRALVSAPCVAHVPWNALNRLQIYGQESLDYLLRRIQELVAMHDNLTG
jgi:hypothetical protein